MARQYPKRNVNYRAKGRRSVSFLSLFLAFFCGYVMASFLDLKLLVAWVNSHLGTKKPEQQIARPVLKPKFEFYTLLANDNKKTQRVTSVPKAQEIPTKVKESQPKPKSPGLIEVTSNHEVYLIQLASFSQLKEAERLRASLVLNGYEVSIAKSMQGTTLWYKVSAGPFYSRGEAEKARLSIAKAEHMTGIIRKSSV